MLAEFFADLKRRRVFRTAAIYAAAAWGVTEASTTVFDKLHFPEWASVLVVIVFLVGFPISVYLSWVFDITSEGIRRTQPLGIRGWGAMVISVIMLFGGTAALFWLLYEPSQETFSEPELTLEVPRLQADTIAVLPFVNAHSSQEDDYFAEGIAETLLAQISKVRNLRVIARDSSFSLRGSSLDARAKAGRLGAAYLLEGSVQRVGSTLRIIARLIDGETGQYLWAETQDGAADEVFAMQDRIAESVAAQLEPISSVAPGAPVVRRVTIDPAAYDHYLRARYAFNEGIPEAMDRAIADFDRAIQLDEQFALAYVGRANARALAAGMDFFVERSEATDPIRGDWHDYVFAARVREIGPELEPLVGPDILKALELTPDLAEAHAAHGLLMLRMRRFEQAETALQRAIKINPNDAFSHDTLGLLYLELNQYELAKKYVENALSLDPLSVYMHMDLAAVLIYTREQERAIAHFETIRAMAPDRYAWFGMRYPLWQTGKHLELARLTLDAEAAARNGELDSEWQGAFYFWGLETNRLYLGDIGSARRFENDIDDSDSMTEVPRCLQLSKQIWAEHPIDAFKGEEMSAGFFRLAIAIHDESFKEAYHCITKIMTMAPDGVPISPMSNASAGRYALALGDCKVAREHFERAGRDLGPLDWPYGNVYLDFLYAYVDAIDYAIALRCMGEEEHARDLIDGTLDWLDEMEANGYGVSQIPVVRAKAHILRGEIETGLDYLERYAALPGPILIGIKNDPAFESVENDPRFLDAVAVIRRKNQEAIEQIDRAVEESGLEF
jgi:TolB-like protein/lipoprotein NlpI